MTPGAASPGVFRGGRMHRPLLIVGGILNSLLALFHVSLNLSIHVMPGLSAGQHALMEMLGTVGTLTIIFFAVGSLGFITDVLTTRLGRLFLGFVVVLYVSRAIEEIVISPAFSPVIFGVCAVVAIIYAVLLLKPLKAEGADRQEARA
jgi:hypothetical protein